MFAVILEFDVIEGMEDAFPDVWDEIDGGIKMFCNKSTLTKYKRSYRNVFKVNLPKGPVALDGESDTALIGLSGINTSRILATLPGNIIYGYDDETDIEQFNTEYRLNTLHIFGAFRIAAKLLVTDNNYVVVNEAP